LTQASGKWVSVKTAYLQIPATQFVVLSVDVPYQQVEVGLDLGHIHFFSVRVEPDLKMIQVWIIFSFLS
jgi:hypothetical protein